MNPVRLLCCAAVLLAAGASSAGAAGFRYFVHIPEIAGTASAPGHENWIEAVSFGADADRSLVASTTGPRDVQFTGLGIAKLPDAATPHLFHAAATGFEFAEVTLDVVHADTDLPLYRVRLKKARIDYMDQTVGRAGMGDFLRLAFGAVEWTYTAPGGDKESSTHWDTHTNTGGVGPLPSATATPGPDSDGDGIPDSYETAHGLNPSQRDADGDHDGDGETNYEEYIASTKANDAKSVFRVTGIVRGDGTMLLTWSSVAGKTYVIRSANSPAGPWNIVQSGIPSAGDGETSRVVAAGGPAFFYRVETY